MIKIGISGVCGKMGRRILHLAGADREIEVVLGLERAGHPELGSSIEGIKVTDNARLIKECDCFIEFTSPAATIEHLSSVAEFSKAVVIGTTGLSLKEQDKIQEAAKTIPIVFSPNMSIGVNLLFELLKTAAQTLKQYDVSIQETHHIHKKDAPSGTAKKIAQIINEQGFNLKIEDIKAERIDEVVGDHRIVFESDVDKIELFHSAKTRDIFAQGAVRAAKWVVVQEPGIYSMKEVLSLR